MRIFGSDRIQGLMGRLGMEEGEAIEHGMVTRAIERAQKQVEGRNFEIRKHLLEYDDVMNKQREAIYKLRRDIFDGTEGRDYVLGVAEDILETWSRPTARRRPSPAEWTLSELVKDVLAYFDIDLHARRPEARRDGRPARSREEVWAMVEAKYDDKESAARARAPADARARRAAALRRPRLEGPPAGARPPEGGHRPARLRPARPPQEYKKESYELFQELKERVEDTVIKTLFRLEPVSEQQLERSACAASAPPRRSASSSPRRRACQRQELPGRRPGAPGASRRPGPPPAPQPIQVEEKIGRNDPCPCGSGKKYKKCHGATASGAA